MSTWLANRCIGTDTKGYGALLGEVCFTISRVSSPSELAAFQYFPLLHTTTSDVYGWKHVVLESCFEINSTTAKQ